MESGKFLKGSQPMTRASIEVLESRIAPAVIYVTTLSDHEISGKITLRDALAEANGASTPATIDFGSSAHVLKGVVTLASPLPAITADMTINAPGITINGAKSFTGLSITGGANISITGLTITNGRATFGSPGGGGLYVNDAGGQVTLSQCVIKSNITSSPANSGQFYYMKGGGIDNEAGSLTISSSKIMGNSAIGGPGPGLDVGFYAVGYFEGDRADGGGIFNAGTLTIEHSQITGNVARAGDGDPSGYAGGSAYGGGIANIGTVNIVSSRITGNLAVGGHGSVGSISYGGPGGAGGGGYGGGFSNAGASVTIHGSVISGNAVVGGAGSIGAKATNGASGGNGGSGYQGGNGGNAFGAGVQSTAGTVAFANSTVSANVATGGAGGNGSNGGRGANAAPTRKMKMEGTGAMPEMGAIVAWRPAEDFFAVRR
jgi:hypothetical protein